MGSTHLEGALVEQWLEFCSREIEPLRQLSAAFSLMQDQLAVLDTHCVGHTFLVSFVHCTMRV